MTVQSNYEKVYEAIEGEIKSARNQHYFYSSVSAVLLLAVIASGALTTFYAATGNQDKICTATLALLTTIGGTLEKNFGFGKKGTGYRKAKTHFQNLKIRMLAVDQGNPVPQEILDDIQKYRLLKADLTDD